MSKRVYKNLIYSTFLWGVCLPSFLACQVDKKGEVAHMSKMKKLSDRIDVQIDLYGKVLDQQGLPVEGADVELGVTRFSPNPKSFFATVIAIHAKTDTQGCFSLLKEKGRDISIENVRKKGFEYSREQNPNTSFEMKVRLVGDTDPRPLISDPKNPLVLRVRKKGEEAFVLTSGLTSDNRVAFGFTQEESGTQKGIDIVKGLEIKEKTFLKPTFNGDPLFCDLKAKATFDAKTKTWTMVLTAGGDGAGILFSDRLLYEAPPEGYQPSYTIQPEAFRKAFSLTESPERVEEKWGPRIQNPGIYLYLRSRTPGLYSRTHISHLVANKEKIWLSGGSTVLNPYGDRVLEEATDLPLDVDTQLSKEVRESYQRNPNGRPPKPDLQRLVREWEKNRPLTEKLKDMFKRRG